LKLEQAKRDYYRRRAKEEGYRSRAAYKLQQLNNKYHLMHRGSKVVDIGCAPGGWLQVASEAVGNVGMVVGIDLAEVKPPSKNTVIIQDDVNSEDFLDKLGEALRQDKCDLVLADLSPKLSGIWDVDHFKQIDLCMRVVDLLPSILESGGATVMKAFHGDELQALVERLRLSFPRVEISKPNASRKESSEVYLVGIEFSGTVPARQGRSHESEPLSEEHSGSNASDW
jgi:23S rRNA (uridine2552-2'-O)-methyltransferase